jgi:GDPmannose 4,6-dehydratase
MARALITGVTGQDGSLLAELLVSQGAEVVGLARDPAAARGHENLAAVAGELRFVAGDLLDPASLRAAVAEVRPDELYHLAAPTFVPASWEDPTGTFAAIAGGTATLLDAARVADPAMRVVVFTSSEVFGDAGESPQRETSPMRPRSPYGAAKLAALHLVRAYRERYGLHASAAITFNHESERRPERFVTRKVTKAAAAIALGRQEEVVLGDLDAVRDWSAARDVVRGATLIARADPGELVLASGVGRTVGDLVHAAFAAAGVDPEGRVRVDPAFVRAAEATPPVGDPSLAHAALGWAAEIAFEELIGSMVEADLRRLAAAPA